MRLAPYFRQAAEKFTHIDLHPEIWLKTQPACSASTHLFLNAIQPWENAAAITGSRSVSSMFDKLVRAIRCAFFRDCRDIARWKGAKRLLCLKRADGKRETGAVSLPQGKLNAVRAAFKAGLTPARIAREFGISRSDVSRALSGDDK